MNALALSFGSPLVLLGLLALPLIWWLLRLTPPKPKQEVFPPTRILSEIAKREETPAQSPWWLTLLSLLMAALVVLALSEPIWNAQENKLTGGGPVLIVLDDGWSSGEDWEKRKSSAKLLLDDAENSGRPVALVFTSDGAKADLTSGLVETVRARLTGAEPKPIRTDLSALAGKLSKNSAVSFTTLAWLSGGLSNNGSKKFVDAIKATGVKQMLYFAPNTKDLSVLTKVANTPEALTTRLERVGTSGTLSGEVAAFDQKGRSISTSPFSLKEGEKSTVVKFTLPVELRNEVTRIAISDANNAGAVQLLDERFRRRRVGLISGGNADQAQPLLSPLYFISRALNPFSEIREARAVNVAKAVPELIQENVSTLVLADIGTLPVATYEMLEKWVQKGGMLVRFAGPRLATAKNDNLVPVELRRGGRSLGGTLTWGTPQPLASFDEKSPFNGIPVPKDVSVSRQVLAEPGIELKEKTWASLADGTPLVTASKRGQGWIVLFHVTADASWSNLPLSGSFVDMLRRIVAVSNGAIAADRARSGVSGKESNPSSNFANAVSMPPLKIMNGFGKMGTPDGSSLPLKILPNATPTVNLKNRPGTYGTKDAFVALNLFRGTANLNNFDPTTLPENATLESYSAEEATTFKPWLLALALLLLALDCLAVLWMAGALRKVSRIATAAFAVGFVYCVTPDISLAQEDTFDFEHTLRTRIAYVKTGDAQLDSISKKGLTGLTRFIASRTSLEPGEPIGVDIASDELSFYPLLYWPISVKSPVPEPTAMARVDAFMKKGGSVLFDTRDQITGGFGGGRVTPETQKLREILSTLDIPPLEPVPDNHVLTRAFYLLSVFPGRYLQGKLWVEASSDQEQAIDRPTRVGDGVSSILITSNDLSGAWAVEASGAPSLPIVPPNPTQRVYAYRAGVNIIMYTLTGNYKSDQVHIPALLERLGQ